MNEKILARHPDPNKQGTNISRDKYDLVRSAIIAILNEVGIMSFGDLGLEVQEKLTDSFEGSISWYYTTVKLDMEARGTIERVGKGSPQRLRLTAPGR
ncbi:MAG: hypothetical protein JRJ19_13915 [Deltaproteobacteria bacterium]|nr:hypothetical protein [Deltaproteobacteria bacterium]